VLSLAPEIQTPKIQQVLVLVRLDEIQELGEVEKAGSLV
jgi:hypothetical protein